MKLLFRQETTAASQFFALLYSDETIQIYCRKEVINEQRVKPVKNTRSSQLGQY